MTVLGIFQLIKSGLWGSRQDSNGELVTAGGRVLAVVAQAPDFDGAFGRAYAGLAQVHFEGLTYRRDIGHQVRQR